MDLRSVARPDGGVWGVVGAAAAVLVSVKHGRTGMVGDVLWAGDFFQLSALHGYAVPRVSHAGRLPEVPAVHGAHHAADCGDVGGFAFLVPGAAVAVHDLPDLEPVALQRTELWPVHDVREAGGREAVRKSAAGAVRGLFVFVPDSGADVSHRSVN